MKYNAIVLAAGKGTRTNLEYNKVFYLLDDQTIIEHTLDVFLKDDDCECILIVISQVEKEAFEKLIQSDKVSYVFGGKTRQESVYNGLQHVNSDYVMIQDGARPYLTLEELKCLKDTMKVEKACLLMTPVIDTIKHVKDGYVVSTPKRSEYYAAQTPQVFDTKLIQFCYEEARRQNQEATDDASLVELYSKTKIKMVEGSYRNKKVTTKEDL